MKRRLFPSGTLLRAACLGLALLLAPPARAAEIMVFAAASLSDSLREIGALHQQESRDRVLFNFAASSLLARQIEAGAPADIFFSADEARMDALAARNLIEPGTRKSRLGNSLVVVVFHENPLRLATAAELLQFRRLALADPRAVPAGLYARGYLEKQGLWNEARGKVIPTENVRAALAAVESGNVEAGIVYKTDAALSRKVRVAFEIPRMDAPGISYPVALVRDSRQKDAARRFLAFLNSEAAAAVFRRHGFVVHHEQPVEKAMSAAAEKDWASGRGATREPILEGSVSEEQRRPEAKDAQPFGFEGKAAVREARRPSLSCKWIGERGAMKRTAASRSNGGTQSFSTGC